MKTWRLFLILFILNSFFNFAQTLQWGTGYYAVDGNDVAIDNIGNAYGLGTYYCTTNGVFGTYTLNCSGSSGIYVVKTNSAGIIKWVKGFDTDIGNSISSDGGANLFIAGSYSGTAVFGTYSLTSVTSNAFVCKIDSNGNVLWAKSIGNGICEAFAIQSGSAGSSYVTGTFKNTCVFGTYSLTSSGGTDNFIVKLDNNGNILWALKTGGTFDDFSGSITLDYYGSLYVAGSFKSAASFGPYFLISAGGYDSFVTKINSSGSFLWAKKYGGTSDDADAVVSANGTGNIYVGNNCVPPVTLGAITFTSGNSFIHKVDTSGNVIWANKFETTSGQCFINSISNDFVGNVFSTGSFYGGTCSFGTNTLSAAVLTADPFGSMDGFVSKLDGSGNFRWVKKLDGPGYAGGKAIEYRSGKIAVTGNYSKTLVVDSYSISAPFSFGTYPFVIELGDDEVGIKETIKELRVSIYPNPVHDKIFIELKEHSEELYFSLVDETGKELLRKKRITSNEFIDVSHYAKGIYFLQLETNNQTAMRKIVIE